MKKIFLLVMVLLSIGLISAHGENFSETKQVIDLGINCDKLTLEQLESIGDYYMEQMHSGEAHEIMDKMMGGEGSESLKQMHIAMAKRIYCNENTGGMMSGNMMSNNGLGMMGNYNYNTSSYSTTTILINSLLIVLIITVSIWGVRLLWQKK